MHLFHRFNLVCVHIMKTKQSKNINSSGSKQHLEYARTTLKKKNQRSAQYKNNNLFENLFAYYNIEMFRVSRSVSIFCKEKNLQN